MYIFYVIKARYIKFHVLSPCRLSPAVFTKEDVVRCFKLDKPKTADRKIERWVKNAIIVKIEEGEDTGKYRKLKQLLA